MSGLFKGIGAVIIVLVIAAAWLTNTAAGARWAYQRATPLIPGTLSVASIDGTLAGPLTIDALHYRDLDAGIELEVERLRVDLGLLALLRQTVVIESGNATGVRLTLSEPRVEQDDKPLSLDPPINVAINSSRGRTTRADQHSATRGPLEPRRTDNPETRHRCHSG